MLATVWIAASGLPLASGAAYAGPGLSIGHDDIVCADDLLEASQPRHVDVTITDHGPRPLQIHVNGSEKLELVLTRESPNVCRSDMLVAECKLRMPVLACHPVALGRWPLHLSGLMEDTWARGACRSATLSPPLARTSR